MTNHLKRCMVLAEQQSASRSGRRGSGAFHLLVEGAYLTGYWMHLEVPARLTLDHIDAFLREHWLECCGHLSQFVIGRTRYLSFEPMSMEPLWDDFPDDKDMDERVSAIFSPGLKLKYDYDFGSTTALKLRVLAQRPRTNEREIRILARNDAPEIQCVECESLATQVCTECAWSGDAWLCDTCAKNHECGEEMLLPVVNSPRVGVCGYGAT